MSRRASWCWISISIVVVLSLTILYAPPALAQQNTPKNGKQWVVGWTPISDPVDGTRLAFDKGIRDAVENAGGKLLYCSPSPKGGAIGDPAVQANCVDSFIAQNADAIVLWAVDPDAAVSMVEKANKANIPVFEFFGGIPKSSGVDIKLVLKNPNATGARAAAEYMVKELTARYGTPKGLVLEVGGAPATNDAQERSSFFHEVIDKYPDIKVVTKYADWDVSKGTTVVKDWMTAHPETDGIYVATNCSYAFSVKAALEPIGRWLPAGDPKHVIETGVDACNVALNAIKCGQMIDETADMAYTAAPFIYGKMIVNYLQTGVLPKGGDEIDTGDELFPKASVIADPNVAALVVTVNAAVITSTNVTNPGWFGNALEAPPNGLSDCPK